MPGLHFPLHILQHLAGWGTFRATYSFISYSVPPPVPPHHRAAEILHAMAKQQQQASKHLIHNLILLLSKDLSCHTFSVGLLLCIFVLSLYPRVIFILLHMP